MVENSLISPEEYQDLWAVVSESPKIVQRVKAFCKEKLGYADLKTLRVLQKKDLQAVYDFLNSPPV